jgi:hypothetical protein
MLAVSALLAVSLLAPNVATQLVSVFNPTLVSLTDSTVEKLAVLGVKGQVFMISDGGELLRPKGDLYVVVETDAKGHDGKLLAQKVYHFNPKTLAELKTKDERFGECYGVFLPWPENWPTTLDLKLRTKFRPSGERLPELFSKRQTLKVQSPEDPMAICETKNFTATAPTEQLAKRVVKAAEKYRKQLAVRWLGKELPDWNTPCPIKIGVKEKSGGATTFTFSEKEAAVTAMEMDLFGPAEAVVNSVLPHEVMHAVLATHVGKPFPRWADEGIAVLAETAEEQASHDRKCRDYLEEGRGLRLSHLFKQKDYPRDVIALFAQGHSVCRFLLTCKAKLKDAASPEQAVLRFVVLGLEDGWDAAAKAVYGFGDVDALEEAWLAWMHTPESILGAKKPVEKAKPPADETHIPPTKLPK